MKDWVSRFWSRVDKSGECWLWTGSKRNGYGKMVRDGVIIRAHRASYELAIGPIPAGMLIDHRCHTRSCVKPAHLRPVTPKQNLENRSPASVRSSSGVRGVYWNKQGRAWVAHVTHNQVNLYLGRFSTVAEAEAAVIAKRNELFTHNDADRRTA